MKNKTGGSFILIANQEWQEQVHGNDTNKLEEKEHATGRTITFHQVEEAWYSIWLCQHSFVSLLLTLHTLTLDEC